MASQLAAQDYLSRVQSAASRDPAVYAALAAQGLLGALEPDGAKDSAAASPPPAAKGEPSGLPDGLKLPVDTEIVKTQPAGPKSRKRSADGSPFGGNNGAPPSPGMPNIPAGLTIEKKKPGRKPMDPNYHVPSTGELIDRVEITKIPSGLNGNSSAKDGAPAAAGGEEETPLNLSLKCESDNEQPLSLVTKKDSRGKEKDLLASYYGAAASKIPSDYYACKCLSV